MITYQSAYQQAQLLLQAMQQANLADQQLGAILETHRLKLKQLLQRDWIMDQADADFWAKAQPLQIEVNKQLRLLETDVIFLKAARQTATLHRRSQQIQTRVALLLRYCEAILALCRVPE